ncbi:concanavalin A-like lectin/glucanase domain-containing protein [Calycina marina]|uniref:Crh-like protein n=1 Tax=Calycina marina TaxID=1763456 RepID=A0A9P7Z3W1_9HELO|nr:concanavalin A-like lectin/glucanase domain-containing protein [Calycina marina]
MVLSSTVLFAVLASASSVFASDAISCSLDQKCPSSAPCCSQYGQCGAGAYCLGGCDPRMSFGLDSCTPEPVCQDLTTKFTSLDRITAKTEYLGDSSETDWVSDGEPAIYDNTILLTMADGSVGTLLASATYMWYGNVKTTFKTSRGQGVVTAFILLSDVKDEIDYEFVGADLETAQTNFYWQGTLDYNNSKNITLSDTFDNYHTYEIDWTPDSITWLVDDQKGRVLNKADTWNATSNQWDYPQTPARVQFSLWPGGLATNGKGTIDWAGGLVDWNSEDIKNNGYYYAAFQSAEISCYNAKTAPGTNTGKSYTYNNIAATNSTVVDGTKDTVLASFLGTGTDMDAGKASGTASSASAPSSQIETVPGLSGAGVGSNNHEDSGTSITDTSYSSDSSSSDTSSSDSSAQSSSSSSASTSSSGFSQGSDSDSTNTNSGDRKSQEKALQGSVFAGIIAVAAMMAL